MQDKNGKNNASNSPIQRFTLAELVADTNAYAVRSVEWSIINVASSYREDYSFLYIASVFLGRIRSFAVERTS